MCDQSQSQSNGMAGHVSGVGHKHHQATGSLAAQHTALYRPSPKKEQGNNGSMMNPIKRAPYTNMWGLFLNGDPVADIFFAGTYFYQSFHGV